VANAELGIPEKSIGRVRAMRQALEPEGPSVALGHLLEAEAMYEERKWHRETSRRLYERVLEVARTVGDRALLKEALGMWGQELVGSGRTEEGIQHYQEALSLAEEDGDLGMQMEQLYFLGFGYRMLGQFELAREMYQRSLELCERIGANGSAIEVLAALGATYRLEGDWQAARESYQRGIELLPVAGNSSFSRGVFPRLATLCADEGRWEEAEAVLERWGTMVENDEELLGRWAYLERVRGRLEEALARLAPAQEWRANREPGAPAQRFEAAGALLDLGRLDEAKTLADAYLAFTHVRLARLDLLPVCAAIAYARGEREQGDRYAEEGLAATRELGLPFLEAQLLYERGRARDARPDLEAALTLFERLGAKPHAERAQQALGALATP
jgi:tetratricopeptide (TPR) repeat protein